MADTPKIAVLVATHNRAVLLEKALDSLLQQTLAPEQFEVIVIDNGSSDGTGAAFDRVQARAGPVGLRYFFEPNLGVSFARNRGLAETRAPLVAFLDDDAFAEPGWLEALAGSFEQETSRPLCAGGEIVLDWEVGQPAWLSRHLLAPLGRLDHGEARRRLEFPGEQLFGSNMAFERAYLAEIGGFDTRLGRKGSNLNSNEETAVLRRLIADGGCLLYEPEAIVRHWVPRERARLTWFLRRFYAQGVSDVKEWEIRNLASDTIERYGAGHAAASAEADSAEDSLKRRKKRRNRRARGTPRSAGQRLGRLGRRLRTLFKRRDRQSAAVVLFALAHDAGSFRQNVASRLRRWLRVLRRGG